MATYSEHDKLKYLEDYYTQESLGISPYPPIPPYYGVALKEERELRGWTQQQLAEKLGVIELEIWRMEEHPNLPREDFRRKLSELLGKDIYSTRLSGQATDEADDGEVGNQSVQIFFCYAHEDEELLNKLKAHLRPLERQGLIDVWQDRDISAGTEWEQEIEKHLNEADIILLLVSPDFMNSEYCYGIEMKRALERHQRGDVKVIPIIVRPVYWQGILGNIQALPKDALPITDPYWHTLDQALHNVAEGIRKAVERLRK